MFMDSECNLSLEVVDLMGVASCMLVFSNDNNT